jgi:hypothetical protein|nr:MAG TPA: hypothetical protein [Caudoviricetes sp.]
MKRSGKFYYRNERETMEMLGMRQVPGSGNGWVAKEDGENEHLLCQLKSTDGNSIGVKKIDIDKLLLNAETEHKLPVFAVQFLKSGEVYLLVRPIDIEEVAEYIDTGVVKRSDEDDIVEVKEVKVKKKPVVRSSKSAREQFKAENDRKFKKKEISAT